MKKYIKCNLLYSPYYKKWKSFLKENVHGDVPEEVLMMTAYYLGSDEEVPMSLHDAFSEACRDCAPKGSELYEDWYNGDLRKYIPSEYLESSTSIECSEISDESSSKLSSGDSKEMSDIIFDTLFGNTQFPQFDPDLCTEIDDETGDTQYVDRGKSEIVFGYMGHVYKVKVSCID